MRHFSDNRLRRKCSGQVFYATTKPEAQYFILRTSRILNTGCPIRPHTLKTKQQQTTHFIKLMWKRIWRYWAILSSISKSASQRHVWCKYWWFPFLKAIHDTSLSWTKMADSFVKRLKTVSGWACLDYTELCKSMTINTNYAN
jgi:hypothetical protein